MRSLSCLLLGLSCSLLAPGCSDDKGATPDDTGGGDDTDSGGDSDSVEDSDTGGDTDTDTGGDTDTDTGGEPGFDVVSDAPEITQLADVIASSTAVYAVGANEAGDPAVFHIDPGTGAVEVLYSGDPLVLPSGVALSEDGEFVYIADVGSPTTTGLTNGGVFALELGTGDLTELGAAGTIDLPSDVTLAHGGTNVYVSGFTTAGVPAIFNLNVNTGAVAVTLSGDPLVEPLQLDSDSDGTALYVLDGLGAGTRANVLAISLPALTVTELFAGFNTTFPGGVGVDSDNALVYYSTWPASLVAGATDGTGFEVVDTLDLLASPAGLTVAGDVVYLADAGGASGDLFALSY